MKNLITGGAGFIGYHIAEYLSEKGEEVHLIDNLLRNNYDDDFQHLIAKENVTFIQADLTNPATIDQLDQDYDIVYHLAAVIGVKAVIERPHDVIDVNTKTVMNIVDWICSLEKKPKLLFTSTSEIYSGGLEVMGSDFPIPTGEEVPIIFPDLNNARSTYAFSKAWGEMYIHFKSLNNSFTYTNVRYHNVYGPRMGMMHVVPELMVRAYRAENTLGVYSVDHTRAFCYVDDAVQYTVSCAMDAAADQKTVHIGNGQEEVTIQTLAQTVLDVVGQSEIIIKPLPTESGGPTRRCPDTALLKQITGLDLNTSLREGIEKTWAWYRKCL